MKFRTRSPFFERLPEALRRQIVARGQSRTYRTGQILHQRGDRKPKLSIIKSGEVRMYTTDSDGNEITFAILRAGEAFGELTLLADLPRTLDAEAVGRTEVIEIRPAVFHRLMEGSEPLRKSVMENLALTVATALEQLDDDRRLSIDRRLAKALLNLATPSEAGHAVPFSQSALAEYMGVTRVSVGTSLSKLVRRGCVKTGYRQITIVDRAGLERLAGVR